MTDRPPEPGPPRLAVDCRLARPDGFTLDARLEAGAGVTAVVGPSGAGKTTLLHVIAGIERPDAARIELGGARLTDCGPGRRRRVVPPHRRGIGLVFQDDRLLPHRTVAGNLRYGPAVNGRPGPAVEEILDRLELTDLRRRRPTRLSGGQRRRVALGRALARRPELLLLDEPLTGLDPGLRDRVLGWLAELIGAWSIPVLLATHDPTVVESLGARVLTIDGGRLGEPGEPRSASADA